MTSINHSTPSRFGRRLAASACAVGMALAGTVTPASAQSDESSPAPSAESSARLERACLRIPNMTIRAENMIERINGDAETRGSLAWLDTKIADAEDKERSELVTVLTNRRAVRQATVPVLEERIERLAELSARCEEAGAGQ